MSDLRISRSARGLVGQRQGPMRRTTMLWRVRRKPFVFAR